MSDDITPEERQRIHEQRAAAEVERAKRQRTEHMKSALRETLTEPWFQDSIGDALLAKLEAIFSDMRPPRRIADVRDGIEQMLLDRDKRKARGLFLRNVASDTGGEIGRFMLTEAFKAALIVGLGFLGFKVLF